MASGQCSEKEDLIKRNVLSPFSRHNSPKEKEGTYLTKKLNFRPNSHNIAINNNPSGTMFQNETNKDFFSEGS